VGFPVGEVVRIALNQLAHGAHLSLAPFSAEKLRRAVRVSRGVPAARPFAGYSISEWYSKI
jgi:hypothetical protein